MYRLLAVLTLLLPIVAWSADEIRLGGANDLSFATPNQGVATTYTSAGGKIVTKIDTAHVPFRNANGYVDDLVKSGNLLTLYADKISGMTKSFSSTFYSPDNTVVPFLFKATRSMTISRMDCVTTSGTVTVKLQECSSTGGSCTDINTSVITCATTPASQTSFTNSVVDADDWVKIVFATPSSPEYVTLNVRYTE